ncbi:MAG TPA: sodium:solute symporter family protein [Bacillota bacterium]|nr:sodium:solute symporter family protein [Bacillota bacterium]
MIVLAISAFFTKKSIRSYEEYTVASTSLGFFFTFFTYFTTWISGATIIGLATMSFKWGLYQYWFLAVTYIMGAISGPIFLTRIRALNVYTVGDFFALRFAPFEKIVRLLVAASMLCRNLTIIGAQFTTVAFFISIGFNIEFNRVLYFTALFIVTYTALSGMWGVAGTDVFQGLIQLIGIPVLIFYIVRYAGGLDGIFSFYDKIDGISYLKIFENADKTTEIMFLLLAPGLFFIIEDQATWQRIVSSKSEKVAFWGYLAPIGASLFWLLTPCLIGVFSKAIFPNFTAYPVALLNFIFSLPQSATLIIMFAILSAAVSTSDSYLLASGMIFSQDIMRKVFNIKASDDHLILFTRVGIALSGLLSMIAGMRVYDIFDLYMLGAYIGGSTLTVPYLLAWFSKRMNGIGLVAGILCSVAVFTVCAQVLIFSYSVSMMLSMAANLVFAYLFCLIGPPPAREEIDSTYYFSPRFLKIGNIPK